MEALKRLIPFVIAALSLSSCLKEDAWCPTMFVSFKMQDQFLTGDYDTRVRNEVLLYVFKDDKVVSSMTIPHASISGGKYFPIVKTEQISGDIKLVAWAVAPGETETGSPAGTPLAVHHTYQHPEYVPGAAYSASKLAHTPIAGTSNFAPHHHERYLGVLSVSAESLANEESHHDIIMAPAPARIIVNLYDPHNQIAALEAQEQTIVNPYLIVEGGMSEMHLGNPDLGRTGHTGNGTAAPVYADMSAPPGTRANGPLIFTSGMVGVLPSLPGASLTVRVKFMERDIVLTINQSNTSSNFTALHSGDRIIFDYELPADFAGTPDPPANFDITVNDWVGRIVDGVI